MAAFPLPMAPLKEATSSSCQLIHGAQRGDGGRWGSPVLCLGLTSEATSPNSREVIVKAGQTHPVQPSPRSC